MLSENPGIDQMTSEDGVLAIGDCSLGELHARSVTLQAGAVAPQVECYLMPSSTRFDVFQIKTKQIMPFDDVGITQSDFIDELPQHFGFVIVLARNDALPPSGIRQPDDRDAIACSGRIGESKAVCAISL